MMTQLNQIRKRISGNNDLSELLRKGGSAFIIRMLGFASGYIFLLFISRWFGATGNGIYSLSITALMIVTILSRFGADTNLVKIVALHHEKKLLGDAKPHYIKSLTFALLIGLILSVSFYFIADYLAQTVFNSTYLGEAFKIISFAIPAWTGVQINAAVLRGVKKTNWYSFYFQMGRFFLALILLIILYYSAFSNEITLPVLCIVIACYVMLVSSSIHVFILWKGQKSSEQTKISMVELLKSSVPMMFSSSMIFLMGWLSTFFLGSFYPESEVGIFHVVLKLATITSFTLNAINSITAPKISAIFHSGDHERLQSFIKTSTKMIFFTSFPILLVLSIFPKFWLSFFGAEFASGSLALIIVILAQFINSFCGSVGYILQMTGYERHFQRALFTGLLVNISLNILLVPAFGITGAAVTTAASLVVWNIIAVYMVKSKLDILTFYIPGLR